MLTENGTGLSAADVAAVTNNGNGGFFGGDNGGGWWFLILFFAMMNGGWGNGFGNGGLNSAAVPYMMTESTQAAVQNGFNQQGILNGINGLNSTVANGFADAAVARCNAQTTTLQALSNNQMGLYQTLNNNQLGLYQTLNANQNANTAAMNQLAMSLQSCCCDNKQGIESLRYTVATENCADRQAISDGLRDVIANNTANTTALAQAINNGIQSIKDDLCADRLDAERRANAELRTQLNMANLAASQAAQTAQIIQDNNAQTAQLIRSINPPPVPSYNVPNPYTGCCGNQGYYGCGA